MATVDTTTSHHRTGKQVAIMYQLTQLAGEVHRQRLADADRQRLRALHRATRRTQPHHRASCARHAVGVVARVLTLAGGHRLSPTR
jgi:hypothetical protein